MKTKVTDSSRYRHATMLLIIFLFFGSISSEAQTGNAAQSVVGGSSAANAYPFFVSLVEPHSPGIRPDCGGTLINESWILTAGHCATDFVTGRTIDSTEIVINGYIRSNPNPDYERIMSDYIAVYPGFSLFGSDRAGDISLIHLSKKSKFESIALPPQDDTILAKANSEARVIGFGVYNLQNPQQQPDTLQSADIRIISNKVCNEPSRYAGIILPSMVCAGQLTGSPTGSAAGDSGGPLMVEHEGKWVQVGLVSFGQNYYSTTTHPGVYTRISSYRHWIDSTINAYNTRVGLENKGRFDQPQFSMNNNILQVTFSRELPSEASYQVYDMTGRVILRGIFEARNTRQEITLNDLTPGMYVMKVDASNQTYATGKFLR